MVMGQRVLDSFEYEGMEWEPDTPRKKASSTHIAASSHQQVRTAHEDKIPVRFWRLGRHPGSRANHGSNCLQISSAVRIEVLKQRGIIFY